MPGSWRRRYIEERELHQAGAMFMSTIREGERADFAGEAELRATLTWPVHPSAVVLFAHDTGSGQYCPRDSYVASRLRHAGLATLRFDLLSPREAGNPALAFDMALLARRIQAAAKWLATQPEVTGLPLGACASGTGAAAAMIAAATEPGLFSAIVARGARTDLAESFLPRIAAPTLLLVGGRDDQAMGINQLASGMLKCSHRLIVVPGGSRRFEEPGAMACVAGYAAEWFVHYLSLKPAWDAQHGGIDLHACAT